MNIDNGYQATRITLTDWGAWMLDQPSRCIHRWMSVDECAVDPRGEHACRRLGEHRTHICDCAAVVIPSAHRSEESGAQCDHRWSEGRLCSEIEHICRRDGEHETHICTCLATDTPTRAGMSV